MKKLFIPTLCLLLLCCLSLVGCGDNLGGKKVSEKYAANYVLLEDAGYYRDLIMSPNGEFFVREKINDEQAATSGLLYKVVFNENNLLDSITAVYNDTPINVNLQTTLYRKLVHGDSPLAQIAVEYQDGYIKYSFKDANMKSVESFVGAASVRFKIDEKTKKAKVAFLYDKEGKALDYNEYGDYLPKTAQLIFSYDDKGRLSKVAFADKNGKRQSTETNEYELRLKYDEKKNLLLPIEIANYGKSDSLQNNSNNYAKITFKYDDKNRIIEESVFGTDESPQECWVMPVHNIGSYYRVQSYNYAVAKYQYSENELRPQKISFFGKDEQPLATDNVASVKVSYTPEGMYAQREYLGIDDTPVEGNEGYRMGHRIASKTVFAYDDVGNIISEKYYGIDGNPISMDTSVNGFDIGYSAMAEKHFVYDSKRRPTEATFFGTSGDPIDVKGYYYEAGNSADYYVRRAVIEYNDIEDEKAKIIGKEIWYDKDGKELCRQNKERM